jgi:hypothetical protein
MSQQRLFLRRCLRVAAAFLALRLAGLAARWPALWLPAGTYRITRTLVRTGVAGPLVIGEHPDRVILRWDGPSPQRVDRAFNSPEWKAWDGRDDSEMLWFNGRNLRLERVTFDGAGRAGSGFAFKWHDSKDPRTTPSHRISLADVVFRDMARGTSTSWTTWLHGGPARQPGRWCARRSALPRRRRAKPGRFAAGI